MAPCLRDALARRGRTWGSLNRLWLERAPDFSHGCPAFKYHGHWSNESVVDRWNMIQRRTGFRHWRPNEVTP